jgi:hypothetical protein
MRRLGRRASIILAVMWVASGTAADAASQVAAPLQKATDTLPRALRLFEATEPLRVTLTADFGAIAKDRGTTKHDHVGVLAYAGPGDDTVAIEVRLRTRGHYRLRLCQYPPLKIVFDRAHTAHTIFAHQGGGLKLVVQCRSSRSYANYLLEEQLIYRVYNLLTERSFRARLAVVTYVDPREKHAPETRYGFFLEDDDRMAARNSASVFKEKGVYQADTDFGQMTLLAVFQYMIGNTDWSVAGLHNIVPIRDSTSTIFPVPYDFDWSGVIWPPYAQPDARLGIATVRQRIFRGACRTPADLAPVFARFTALKDSIYGLYRVQPGLEPERVKQALEYYDEFYKTINDPGKVDREFIRSCARN